MAVTDLTGTKWRFNESISALNEFSYRLDFTSASLDFFRFEISGHGYYPDTMSEWTLLFQSTLLGDIEAYFSSSGWADEAYRTIEIIGGTDATNSDLITWLQANATQVVDPTITDLTGTRWQLNAVPEVNNKRYSVYGGVYVGGQGIEGFTTITKGFSGATASVTFSNGGTQSSASVFYGTGSTYQGWYHKTKGASVSSGATFTSLATAPIIKFSRGTDITNANLISWLQANATQIIEPVVTFSIGNLPIANMYFGTRQVKKIYLGNTLVWEKETPVPENALLVQDGKLFASGGGYLITTEVTLITFAVGTMSGDLSCQAEEGMTWQEWVDSEYNTGGFIVFDNTIFTPSRTGYIPGVTSSDIIAAGRYVINYGGSAD